MHDGRWTRIGRELSIAAFGVPIETIDASVVDRLTEVFDEAYVRAGQVLWSVGDVLDDLWVMHDGRVRAIREGAPPWLFEGRWFLGDLEGHLEAPVTRTLVAAADFHVFKIRRRIWHGLLEDSFDLTRLTVELSATTVAGMDAHLLTEARLRPRSLAKWSTDRPLSTVERIAFLAELPIARSVGVQALADIAASSDEVVIGEGEVLFEPGAPRPGFFVVVAGEVEARRTEPEVVRRYGAGEVVTGPAALSDERSCWGARARRRARLLAIPFEVWFDLMEAHFDLAQSTLAVLAQEREQILECLAAQIGDRGLVVRSSPSRGGGAAAISVAR